MVRTFITYCLQFSNIYYRIIICNYHARCLHSEKKLKISKLRPENESLFSKDHMANRCLSVD